MQKIKEHINRWNRWRHNVECGMLHKLLVLFGLRKDILFEWTFTDKEAEKMISRVQAVQAVLSKEKEL